MLRPSHAPTRARCPGWAGQLHPPLERPAHQLLCPLSGQVMLEPVVAADGVTYERRAISDWLAVRWVQGQRAAGSGGVEGFPGQTGVGDRLGVGVGRVKPEVTWLPVKAVRAGQRWEPAYFDLC